MFNYINSHIFFGSRKDNLMKRTQERHAFTLIELMTVVVIISMLAAIAVPNFLNAAVRAKVARSLAEQELIVWALESYFNDYDTYPTNQEAGTFAPGDLNRLTTPIPYMSQLPMDIFLAPADQDKREFIETARRGSDTYPYVNFLQAQGSRVSLTPYGLRGSVNYVVYGMGPGFTSFQNPLDAASWAIYSPSNGTISAGSITTFAP